MEGLWCEEPEPPVHGFVMGVGRQYGDKVRYACSTGFRLTGADESVCATDGQWSKLTPLCQGNVFILAYPLLLFSLLFRILDAQISLSLVVTCDSPAPIVHHATLISSSSSTATNENGSWPIGTYEYRCHEGHTAVGTDETGTITVDCLANQQWSVVTKGHCRSIDFTFFLSSLHPIDFVPLNIQIEFYRSASLQSTSC